MISFPRLTIVACLVVESGISDAQTDSAGAVRWFDLQPEYTSFSDVKPTLRNDRDSSIYLLGMYCYPDVELFRRNDSTGSWDPTFHCELFQSKLCDSTIEIGAHSGMTVGVRTLEFFGSGRDTSDIPMASGDIRPKVGLYYITINVANKPYRLNHLPGATYWVQSPNFRIVAGSPKR